MPVNRLIALGVGATGVAVGGAMMGPVGGAVAGVLSGVLGSFFSSLAQPIVETTGESPEAMIRNHDLRKLIGAAIRDTLLLEQQDPASAKSLADGAVELWMSEASAADTSLEPLNEQNASAYFTTDQLGFDELTALDIEAWSAFLTTLATATNTDLPDDLRDRLANALHTKLPRMLRAAVKSDFTGDTEVNGRGYASLQLVMLGKILVGIDQLLESRPDPAALEQIRQFNEQLPETVDRHEKRIKEPRERILMQRVANEIRQLRPHLDKRLDELLRAVAAEGQQTRQEVRGVDRKVVYVLASVGGLALLVVGGWWLTQLGQQETTQAVEDAASATAGAQQDILDAQQDVKKAVEDLKLLAAQNTVINAIELNKLRTAEGVRPTYSPDVLAAAELLKERGTKQQRALGAIVAGNHEEADRLLDELLQDPLAETFALLTRKGDNWYAAGESDKAIGPYETALSLDPGNVLAKINLAYAESFAKLGNLTEHKQRAIQLLEEALMIAEAGSTTWASAQVALGNAWGMQLTGNRAENLSKAAECYRAAATVYTKEQYPETWASIRQNLGNVWSEMPAIDRTENINKAIAFYQDALSVFNREQYPIDWAMTQASLGNAWMRLPAVDPTENILKAIGHYEAVLEVTTEQDNPELWSKAQNNLGAALVQLPAQDPTENFDRAIKHFNAAMRVRTREATPALWASTQFNLGKIWLVMPSGNYAQNVAKSISHFEAALQVRTKELHPEDWAMTHHNLAGAWLALPALDPTENINKAIQSFQSALQVYTQEKTPVDWANNQVMLGYCWWILPSGNRIENHKIAIACHEEALKVYTPEFNLGQFVIVTGQLAGLKLGVKDYEGVLVATQITKTLNPPHLGMEATRAHALLLLNRVEEAEAIYLKHVDKAVEGTPWPTYISADFDYLESLGITHPRMAEIRGKLKAKQ